MDPPSFRRESGPMEPGSRGPPSLAGSRRTERALRHFSERRRSDRRAAKQPDDERRDRRRHDRLAEEAMEKIVAGVRRKVQRHEPEIRERFRHAANESDDE